MNPMHLYAIIPSGKETTFDVAGMTDDDIVHSIPHGNISAVVGAAPSVGYRGLEREQAMHCLVTHQCVVEDVMRSFTVLPVKFGASLPNAEEARRFLAQGKELFSAALAKLAGQVQLEVAALWNLQEVLQEIGREESIMQSKAEALGGGGTATLTDRVAVGQMVQSALERRRAALRDRLLIPTLSDVAFDIVVNPIMDDSMVANLALLVSQSGRIAVEQRLEALDEDLGGKFNFRCVGPLPPYTFASVEVRTPPFEAIDEARRLLGLEEKTTTDEIKQSYRRLAGKWHPDHNLGNPEAETHMAALTRSYDLLTVYAGSPAFAKRNGRQVICGLDRQTVAGAFLIDVRRQESLPNLVSIVH